MTDHTTPLSDDQQPDDHLPDVNDIPGVQSVAEILGQWKRDRTEQRMKQIRQQWAEAAVDEDSDKLTYTKCLQILESVPENFRPLAKAFLRRHPFWYSGGQFHDEIDRPVPADEVKSLSE